MEKEITYIRLETKLKRGLERAAENDGRTLSSLLAKIAADWLKEQKASK
jgi:hypothetical protein